jgi:hypothetical protein
MPEGADDLASDGYDPREVYFKELGRHIASAVDEAKQVDHLAKWNWLANRYRAAAEKYSHTRELNFDALFKDTERGAGEDASTRRR